MKRVFSLFLILAAVMLFAADAKIRIAATTAPIAALTKAVTAGIPGITVEQVVPAVTGCPHDYALTPADVRKLSSADVVVFNGLGMDDVFRKAASKKRIDSSKGVKNLIASDDDDDAKHGKHEKHHGHHHHQHEAYNGHLFAAPSTASQVVFSIADQLSGWYPEYAERFQKNGKKYASELKKIAGEYASFGKKIPEEKRSICASHNIFAYLCRDLGLKMDFLISVHDGHEPSASERLKLIVGMKKKCSSMIAVEKQGSRKAADMLSRETSIPVVAFQLQPDNTDPEAFLQNYRDNLTLLRKYYGRK